MNMFTELMLTVVGLTLLWGSAEIVVKNSSRFAAKIGISPLIVGLTVVSLGTSIPELVVSSTAAIQDDIGISIGNIIGSNVFDCLIPIGAAALITNVSVERNVLIYDLPILLFLPRKSAK